MKLDYRIQKDFMQNVEQAVNLGKAKKSFNPINVINLQNIFVLKKIQEPSSKIGHCITGSFHRKHVENLPKNKQKNTLKFQKKLLLVTLTKSKPAISCREIQNWKPTGTKRRSGYIRAKEGRN